MQHEEECEFQRLLPDGSIVMRLRDQEQRVVIQGVEIPQPLSELYVEMMTQRIPKLRKPIRCVVKSEEADKVYAKVLYYGWQDKSGDVYVDLALTLLDEGLVRVVKGDFFESGDYIRHEREARTKGVGIWSGSER